VNTLTQQIAHTVWHRLTGKQMEELLTEWFRYMDHEDIVRIIYDSAPLVPHILREIFSTMPHPEDHGPNGSGCAYCVCSSCACRSASARCAEGKESKRRYISLSV